MSELKEIAKKALKLIKENLNKMIKACIAFAKKDPKAATIIVMAVMIVGLKNRLSITKAKYNTAIDCIIFANSTESITER